MCRVTRHLGHESFSSFMLADAFFSRCEYKRRRCSETDKRNLNLLLTVVKFSSRRRCEMKISKEFLTPNEDKFLLRRRQTIRLKRSFSFSL